ncbi:MAG TPA: sigma factor, partial [Planctomycetota bacterium]|nr:sigma factor [Planctomycetota bacterium]
MDAPFDAPLDSFLAEREAVSGLARRLARGDVHAAEDLEQEVWAALLARPPREASSARGWLRAVTRTRAVER